MQKFFKKFHKGQSGFTLIELLIVIVILGVLAAAIIPNLSKFVGSGQVGAANAELATVKTAVQGYEADNNGGLPVGTQPTAATEAGSALITNSLLTTYISSATITSIYSVDTSGVVYCLTSSYSNVVPGPGYLSWVKTGTTGALAAKTTP